MSLNIKSEFLGVLVGNQQETQQNHGMVFPDSNSEWIVDQFEEVSTESIQSPGNLIQQNAFVNNQQVYHYQSVPPIPAYYPLPIDLQAPQLELQQNVKSSQACHDAAKGVLTADVREIPVVISHPQLFNFSKLIVRFSNFYDKTGQYIDLSARGPCPHDHEQFLMIRGEHTQCKLFYYLL